jgi:hypothetical protein
MDFIRANLLTLIVFIPVLGALVLLLLPARNHTLIRWTALLFSLIPLGLSFILWNEFHADPCYDLVERACFDQQAPWFPLLNSSYHVGIDGISLTLVLLTTLLTPLAILMSWTIVDRVKMYMALFLLLEMGMLGVFVALDLLIFFVFWEFGLVPMYFLINQWGSANRQYASFKFFISTMAGSLGLLLSIQLIGLLMGTFDIPELMRSWPAFDGDGGTVLGFIPVSLVKNVAFWAFTLAFAIKVPVWPFHTWLPDAHTEAPTAGSMILAGVLLKLGARLRDLCCRSSRSRRAFAPVLAVLAMSPLLWVRSHPSRDRLQAPRCLQLCQPYGFCGAGVAAAAWVGLRAVQCDAAPRRDHRPQRRSAQMLLTDLAQQACCPRRHDLRAAPPAIHADGRLRSPHPVRRHSPLHVDGVAGAAGAGGVCQRVHGGARCMARRRRR